MIKTNERAGARSIVAAFLAALLVPALLAAQGSPRTDRPGQPRVERPRPGAGLDLTPEQTKALEGFRKARRDEGQAFRDGMAKLRVEMRELAKDPKANQAKIDGLIDKMTGLSAERRKAGFRTRIERDKIFTPQQLETIKTLRSRLAGRARFAGRGAARLGRMGAGRAASFRSNLRRMARLRALRHRRLDRWRRR
ncbi:MAG TPA: periplasmic heavy metal sensor [Holophaga sp.]|nr:periplasmic heavy metal sensor [Holophaga sp.]